MMDIFTWIREYWFVFILFIGVVATASIKIYKFINTPSGEQLKKVQQWLIWAVAKAEEVLGSGTGQLKLRYVYDMFITKFPVIAKFITYDEFKAMTEKALEEFKEMLENNKQIKQIYDWETIDSEGGQDE